MRNRVREEGRQQVSQLLGYTISVFSNKVTGEECRKKKHITFTCTFIHFLLHKLPNSCKKKEYNLAVVWFLVVF